MISITRPFHRPAGPSRNLDGNTARPLELDPPVVEVARRVATATPDTPLGQVAEMVRASPCRAVPIVNVNGDRLIGLATEASVARALLAAPDAASRQAARQSPIGDAIEEPGTAVDPFARASEVSATMDACGRDVLPVQDWDGRFLGLASRSDLVQELIRPFRPPTIGGMATPTGVYLTTGAVCGGASALSLVLTGALMYVVNHLSQALLAPAAHAAVRMAGSGPTAELLLGNLLPAILSLVLFLTAIRLSPLAGYHAAEHQVVHAIERSEPLLVENVRAMPRVHPRCGTNFVAGVLICGMIASLIEPLQTRFLPGMDGIGYAFGAVAALAYWRTLGSWLQQYVTTRPATDRQIESGIRAAREVLAKHSRAPQTPERPAVRLWRMGMLQMVFGMIFGYALLMILGRFVPILNG